MELHEGVIIIAVVAVCSVIVHKVYRFAMRGKTYEEAIAEQRKTPLEYMLLGKGGKDKNKDKKTKKVGKKVKEKPVEKEKVDQPAKVNPTPKAEGTQKNPVSTVNKAEGAPKAPNNAASAKTTGPSSNTTVHSEKHRAVEFGKPEAEFVIDQAPTQQDENKPKKKKKVEKGVKPILLNRDEVSPVDVSAVKDEPTTPCTVNHFEESKPKDEFMKRKQSKEEAAIPIMKPKEKVKAAVVEKAQLDTSDAKAKVPPVAEKEQPKHVEKVSSGVTPLSAPQAVAQTLPPAVPVKEQEKESRVPEVTPMEVNSQTITPTVAVLQETKRKKKKSDLVTLQQMAGSGGVNVSLLEPLICKAELSRSEVQNLIDLLLNKQQESAVENAEWTEGRQDPVVKLKKQLAEKEKALIEEQAAVQGWQTRVKDIRAELNGERSRLSASVRRLEASVEALTAKLQNETDSHANEKRGLTTQLQELQTKLSEERLQVHKLQEQEGTTVATLQQEFHKQSQQMEVHIARLNEQLQEGESGLKLELTRLQEDVENREKARVMLSTELCQVREELAALQATSSGSEEERNRLRDLANKAETAAKIAANEANTAREMARRIEEDSRNSRIELEQQVAELKAVTTSLKMREAELQAEVSRMIEEANAEKSRIQVAAREAEERARNVEEALARVEAEKAAGGQAEVELQSKHQRLIQEKEAFIQQLSEELKYYKTEIPKLSEALETQRKKNDELRHKNWKAMDALTITENNLKAHLKTSQNVVIEESQKFILGEQEAVKQLLQRLLPNVIVEDAKSHSEWLNRFEASACDYLKQSNQAQVEVVCDGHEKEIQHLQARVLHFQTIVKDTESILSKLQNSVEEQEAQWAEQVRKKEDELKHVVGERNDLIATLEELQGLETLSVSTETQEKVKELNSRLTVEEEEKKKLIAQCDNLQRGQCNLETELSVALAKVEQLQKDINSLSHDLSTRKEQNDDLSKEVVRLNSLIKIGQASLSQEQLQVKEMEEELEKLKVQPQNHTATNGPASESTISEGGSAKN